MIHTSECFWYECDGAEPRNIWHPSSLRRNHSTPHHSDDMGSIRIPELIYRARCWGHLDEAAMADFNFKGPIL